MFDIQNYESFLAAILVFQLIPGAGTIAILNATAAIPGHLAPPVITEFFESAFVNILLKIRV